MKAFRTLLLTLLTACLVPNLCGMEPEEQIVQAITDDNLTQEQLDSWLIQHGIDDPLNSFPASRQTLLHIAAADNAVAAAQILLEQGANLNVKSFMGFTPLNYAASPKMAELLMDYGATVNQQDIEKTTNPAIKKFLQTVQIANAVNEGTLTEPQLTSWINDGNAIDDALVNSSTGIKYSLLEIAIKSGQAITALLLKYKANPNIKDIDGDTPLFYAVSQSNMPLVQLLLQYNANPNIENRDGNTPLHLAASAGDLNLAKILLDKRADPNIKNSQGNTALFCALLTNDSDKKSQMIELLLNNGANIASANNDGYTLLTVALSELNTFEDWVKKLDKDCYQPDLQELYKIIKLLIQHDAPVTQENLNLTAVTDPEINKLLAEAYAQQQMRTPSIPPVTIIPPLISPVSTKPVGPSTPPSTGLPVPTGQPGFTPPTGEPAITPVPVVPAAVAGAGTQTPLLFNRKNLVRFAIVSALTAMGYGAYYLASAAPTDLNGEQLQDKLVTALANHDYYYAYALAQKNPQAVQDLDSESQQNIKTLIAQAEVDLINETTATKSLNPFQPNTSTQLQYLADLLKLIEQPVKDIP